MSCKIARSVGAVIVSGGLACAVPVLASAETQQPDASGSGEVTPSPEATNPDTSDDMGRITVKGEVQITPNSVTGESEVLSLRTAIGSIVLETDASSEALRNHVGETFEVTGTVRPDELGGGAVLDVESYRPAERTQVPDANAPAPSDGPSIDRDGDVPPPPF